MDAHEYEELAKIEYEEVIQAIAELAEELSTNDKGSRDPVSKLYAVKLDIDAAIGKRMRDLREHLELVKTGR